MRCRFVGMGMSFENFKQSVLREVIEIYGGMDGEQLVRAAEAVDEYWKLGRSPILNAEPITPRNIALMILKQKFNYVEPELVVEIVDVSINMDDMVNDAINAVYDYCVKNSLLVFETEVLLEAVRTYVRGLTFSSASPWTHADTEHHGRCVLKQLESKILERAESVIIHGHKVNSNILHRVITQDDITKEEIESALDDAKQGAIEYLNYRIAGVFSDLCKYLTTSPDATPIQISKVNEKTTEVVQLLKARGLC